MGYQVVAATAAEALSDEVWMDLIALASRHGFSAPRLSLLGRHEQVDLTEEAKRLHAALGRALSIERRSEFALTLCLGGRSIFHRCAPHH